MKIKRYTAQSMRAALALVRAEQGTDAVILSSRRVDEGIEVIAAVDYDEALFVDATRLRAPAKPSANAAASTSATPAEAPIPTPAAAELAPRAQPQPPAAARAALRSD